MISVPTLTACYENIVESEQHFLYKNISNFLMLLTYMSLI